jgi:hypothetical protein
MKKIIWGLALLFLLAGGNVGASVTGPYIVYTAEILDAGDVGMFEEVPGGIFLEPHVYAGDYKGGHPLKRVLDKLRSFKPKLYKGTEITKIMPEYEFPIRSVTVQTAVKTQREFKILMAEIIYTFDYNAFELRDEISVTFHFEDPKLEKKYGGKQFRRKDVPFAAFLLNPPQKKSHKTFDEKADEIEQNDKVMEELQK